MRKHLKFVRHVDELKKAGLTWAPFAALKTIDEAAFDAMDLNHGGFVLLDEWYACNR